MLSIVTGINISLKSTRDIWLYSTLIAEPWRCHNAWFETFICFWRSSILFIVDPLILSHTPILFILLTLSSLLLSSSRVKMGPDGSNLDESLLVYHRYPFTLKYLNLSEQIQWWTPCLIKVFKICTKTVNQSNSIKNCKSHCVWIFSASPLPDCLSITSLADWSSENADTFSITDSSVISALWNLYCDFSFLHFFEYNPLFVQLLLISISFQLQRRGLFGSS